MSIRNWLKKKLRAWLEIEDQSKPDPSQGKTLVATINGETREFRVHQAIGLHLVTEMSEGSALFAKHQADDPEEFLRIWRLLGNYGYKFEDGTPVEP